VGFDSATTACGSKSKGHLVEQTFLVATRCGHAMYTNTRKGGVVTGRLDEKGCGDVQQSTSFEPQLSNRSRKHATTPTEWTNPKPCLVEYHPPTSKEWEDYPGGLH